MKTPSSHLSRLAIILLLSLGRIDLFADPVDIADTNFITAAFAYIKAAEYDITWQDRVLAYQSPNRSQNMRITYLDDGFAAEPRIRETDGNAWQVALRMKSWGRANFARLAPGLGHWEISKNFGRYKTPLLEVEYHNTAGGMQQNFKVLTPVVGLGPLTLEMQVELTDLTMTVNEENNFVSFHSGENDQEIMQYRNLRVIDATGAVLPARMIARSETEFAIVVEDELATYPVLIDPTLVSAITGDQSSSKFGFSVAPCGDIKGLGATGGVLIGAPNYDEGEADEGEGVPVLFGRQQRFANLS